MVCVRESLFADELALKPSSLCGGDSVIGYTDDHYENLLQCIIL